MSALKIVPESGPERDALKEQRRLATRVNFHMNDRLLEWFSAAAMIWWAVYLTLPGNSFALPTFAAFHRFGFTETFWSAAFGIIGGARAVALFINGRWPRRSPFIRAGGALFGCVTWIQICVMQADGNWQAFHAIGPATGLYALLTCADFYSVLRAAFDARYYSPGR